MTQTVIKYVFAPNYSPDKCRGDFTFAVSSVDALLLIVKMFVKISALEGGKNCTKLSRDTRFVLQLKNFLKAGKIAGQFKSRYMKCSEKLTLS